MKYRDTVVDTTSSDHRPDARFHVPSIGPDISEERYSDPASFAAYPALCNSQETGSGMGVEPEYDIGHGESDVHGAGIVPFNDPFSLFNNFPLHVSEVTANVPLSVIVEIIKMGHGNVQFFTEPVREVRFPGTAVADDCDSHGVSSRVMIMVQTSPGRPFQ